MALKKIKRRDVARRVLVNGIFVSRTNKFYQIVRKSGLRVYIRQIESQTIKGQGFMPDEKIPVQGAFVSDAKCKYILDGGIIKINKEEVKHYDKN